MKTLTAFAAIVGLGFSATLGAAESRRTNNSEPTGGDRSASMPSQAWASESDQASPTIPAKLLRYAARVVKKYDSNGNGVLEENEWSAMPDDLRKLGRDGEGGIAGGITVEQVGGCLMQHARLHPLQDADAAWRRVRQPPAGIFQPATPVGVSNPDVTHDPEAILLQDDETPASDEDRAATPPRLKNAQSMTVRGERRYYVAPSSLPAGLPDWFGKLDANGDGQLTLGEFASDGSPAKRKAFARYDQNGDGVITPDEVLRFTKKTSEKKPSTATKDSTEKKSPASVGP
jgi:hypothetical protein